MNKSEKWLEKTKMMFLKNFNKILRLLRFSYVYIWVIKGLQLVERRTILLILYEKSSSDNWNFFYFMMFCKAFSIVGNWNWNPSSSALFGMIFLLLNNKILISPKINFIIN